MQYRILSKGVALEHLLHEIAPLVSRYGLFVVFWGMILEGTTMIIATGILCYLGMLPVASALPVAILGAIAGDQLWYLFGNRYAVQFLSYFPSIKKRVEHLSDTVRLKGHFMALSSRFIYGGALAFPFALGVYDYPYTQFLRLDILGVALWASAGIALGYLVGSGTGNLVGTIETVEHFLLLVGLTVLVVWFLRRYVKGNAKNHHQS